MEEFQLGCEEEFLLGWKEDSNRFERDEFYESIRAPKWVDFSAANSSQPDDNAWFCLQAGCDQKHGTQLDETPLNHTCFLKVQASKTRSYSSPKSARENKSRGKQRTPLSTPTLKVRDKSSGKQRTPLSTPTLKARDKTPGKASALPMSAGRIRRKQSLENEDPNRKGENMGNEKSRMSFKEAEALPTTNCLSSANGMDASQGSPPCSPANKMAAVVTPIHCTPELGKDTIIKPTGAFTTPRLKNRSIKLEPFQSIQNSKALSAPSQKGTGKGKAVKSISFQTPSKNVTKPPSKDLTPITKICADMKKLAISSEVNFIPGHFCRSSRCAANDPNYSSPVSVPAKKYLASRALRPDSVGDSPLLRSRCNLKTLPPGSSKAKDSRNVLKGSPSSHRKALFTETILQPCDLLQAKVMGYMEDEPDENQGEKASESTSQGEKFPQTVDMNAILTQKWEAKRVLEVAHSGFDEKCEKEHVLDMGHACFNQGCSTTELTDDAVEERILDESYLMSDMEVDGESRKNSTDGEHLSVIPQQIETQRHKSGEGRIEASSERGQGRESRLQVQSEPQIAAIGGERGTYVLEEVHDCQMSESSDAENIIPDELNGTEILANVETLTSLQTCLEAFPKGKGDELQMDFDVKPEHTGFVKVETSGIQVDSDVEPDNTGAGEEETRTVQGDSGAETQNGSYVKEKTNVALFDSDIGSESTTAGGEETKKFQVDSDAELQNRVTVKEETNEFQVDYLEEEKIKARVESENEECVEDRNADLQGYSQSAKDITDQNVLEGQILQEIIWNKTEADRDSPLFNGTGKNGVSFINSKACLQGYSQSAEDITEKNVLEDQILQEDKTGTDCDNSLFNDMGNNNGVFFQEHTIYLEEDSQSAEDITDQNVLEDHILEEVLWDKTGNNFQTLVQDLRDDGEASLEVEGNAETILASNSEDFIIFEARQGYHDKQLHYLDSKGLFSEVSNSNSRSESDGNSDSSQFAEDVTIKSEDCGHGLNASKHCHRNEQQQLESKDINLGQDCHENCSFSQSETIEEETDGKIELLAEQRVHDLEAAEYHEVNHSPVLECSNSEVISDSGAECDKNSYIPQPVSENQIYSHTVGYLHQMGPAKDPLTGFIPSDAGATIDEKLALGMDCNLKVELVTMINGDSVPEELDSVCCSVREVSIKTPVYEEKHGESEEQNKQCTSATPNKRGSCHRRSSDMNSKTNCSNEDLCEDKNCNISTKDYSSSLVIQIPEVNGSSALQGGKHKKIKPTCPKPFRLRTEERGVLKETGGNKKTDQFAGGMETTSTVSDSSSVTTKQLRKEKNLQIESTKPDKAKSDAALQCESSKLDKAKPANAHKGKPLRIGSSKIIKPKSLDEREEMKNAPEQLGHHALKMPFFGQPFKPQRSTKKLTVPKEPNFHPIHPRKTCVKNH